MKQNYLRKVSALRYIGSPCRNQLRLSQIT